MSLYPEAIDRASTWFRAIASLIGFGLVAVTPWIIWADAITRASR